MERVETLIEKLQQQVKEHASVNQLLLTVHMLQHELVHSKDAQLENENGAHVTVSMPLSSKEHAAAINEIVENKNAGKEEKIIEVLQINEAEVEAELDEIKRKADVRQKIGGQSKPPLLFDTASDDDIPTLTQQIPKKTVAKEINESIINENTSLNDKLKEVKTEVAATLTDSPIKDIKKAIGVNDRFVFINELFRGDEVMYERSIKTINSFDIWPEAEYWIRRELKFKLSWQDNNQIVQQFDHLVKRRFS